MKLEISQQIFEKYLNIKFHENPSCGSRFTQKNRHEEMDSQTDRQTDMKKLIVAFHNFSNAPKQIVCRY